MKKILESSQDIEPFNVDFYKQFGPKEGGESDYELLEAMSKKKLFPHVYAVYLSIIDADVREILAKKLLKIFLYADSKLNNEKALHSWLLSGPLPVKTYYGIDSMKVLSRNVEKAVGINRNINSTADKIGDIQSKLAIKSTSRAVNSLRLNQEKYNRLNHELDYYMEEIEDAIEEIESTLAIGRKL